MVILGNDVYIQRGEDWTLDFDVTNENGDPFMPFIEWKNPFVVITVTAARYVQDGDYRHSWWLDMSNRLVQNADGSMTKVPIKKFISTEPLFLEGTDFSLSEVMATYGTSAGGPIVLNPASDFDITNYLFYIEPNFDGNRIYKYIKSYDLVDGQYNEVWEEYNFRVIKQFKTHDWVEQKYLFDIKILSGESFEENLRSYIEGQGFIWGEETYDGSKEWEVDGKILTIYDQINRIKDKEKRDFYQSIYDAGMPLMPDYDTKFIVLYPTNLFVGANIQKGV